MLQSPLIKFSFPALLVGALGGYFVAGTLKAGSAKAQKPEKNLREQFLSSEDDVVDYEKLARVCLNTASRTPHVGGVTGPPPLLPDSPELQDTKASLDDLMARSLEEGTWGRSAGILSKMLLNKLPPSDVADFEALLRTTIERGDLKVQRGAWVPHKLR